MTKETRAEAPRSCRWPKVLLFLSLALNLLVLGAVGAMVYKHFESGMSGYGMHDMWRGKTMHERAALGRPGLMLRASRRLMWRLPRARREALRGIASAHRETIRTAYAQVGRARQQLIDALAAEPFDESTYAAALARLRKADTAARMAVLDLADAFLRALTPAERRLYGRILRKMGARGRWKARHERP